MAEITWIKLRTNMFDDEKIKLIEALPNGDSIIVIWMKLLAQAGKVNCGGYIMITENIPMNLDEMVILFRKSIQEIKFALTALERYGMIEIDENSTIFITNWEKHQNIDGLDKIREQNRLRKQKERERKKLLQLGSSGHVTVTGHHATEKEKDIDKEKEIIEILETEVSNDSVIKKMPSKKSEDKSLLEQQFEEWWNIYGKKMQKPKALTLFKRIVKEHGYDILKANTETFVKNYISDKKYQPYPTTFLNSYHPDDDRFKEYTNKPYSNNNTNSHQGVSQLKPISQDDLFRDA